MTRRKRRIVAVQGSLQMLMALFVLYFLKESGEEEYEDILVIHRVYSTDVNYFFLTQAIFRLAEKWPWSQVVNLIPLETDDFDLSTERGKQNFYGALGSHVDVIMTTRNFQLSNFRLLTGFPDAKKITYGDGFGMYDSVIADGYPQFDEGIFLLPYQISTVNTTLFGPDKPVPVASYDSLPWRKIPREIALKVIRGYAASDMYLRFCSAYQASQGRTLLVMLSNHADSGIYNSAVDEVAVYYLALSKTFRDDDTILIKPHPRERLNQAGILKDALVGKGRTASVIYAGSYLAMMPMEVLAGGLSEDTVFVDVSGSSTVVTLQYLFQKQVVKLWGEEGLGPAKLTPELIEYNRITSQLADKVATWDEKGPLYSGHLAKGL